MLQHAESEFTRAPPKIAEPSLRTEDDKGGTSNSPDAQGLLLENFFPGSMPSVRVSSSNVHEDTRRGSAGKVSTPVTEMEPTRLSRENSPPGAFVSGSSALAPAEDPRPLPERGSSLSDVKDVLDYSLSKSVVERNSTERDIPRAAIKTKRSIPSISSPIVRGQPLLDSITSRLSIPEAEDSETGNPADDDFVSTMDFETTTDEPGFGVLGIEVKGENSGEDFVLRGSDEEETTTADLQYDSAWTSTDPPEPFSLVDETGAGTTPLTPTSEYTTTSPETTSTFAPDDSTDKGASFPTITDSDEAVSSEEIFDVTTIPTVPSLPWNEVVTSFVTFEETSTTPSADDEETTSTSTPDEREANGEDEGRIGINPGLIGYHPPPDETPAGTAHPRCGQVTQVMGSVVYPFVVSFPNVHGSMCLGTLVEKGRVLTSHHCLQAEAEGQGQVPLNVFLASPGTSMVSISLAPRALWSSNEHRLLIMDLPHQHRHQQQETICYSETPLQIRTGDAEYSVIGWNSVGAMMAIPVVIGVSRTVHIERMRREERKQFVFTPRLNDCVFIHEGSPVVKTRTDVLDAGMTLVGVTLQSYQGCITDDRLPSVLRFELFDYPGWKAAVPIQAIPMAEFPLSRWI